jgi:hypothetical protein
MAVNQPMQGELSTMHSHRLYELVAPGSMSVTISAQSSFDNILELYQGDSRDPIAQDDDSGSGTNALLSAQLAAGTYYVMVGSYSGSSTGPFTVTCSVAVPTGIGLNQPVQGQISPATPHQNYQLTLAQAGSVSIAVQGSFDSVLELYRDQSQQPLMQDDDSGPGTNALIQSHLASGNYTIRVRGFTPQLTGNFTLTVSSSGAVATTQTTPTSSAIQTLEANRPMAGTISATAPRQLYTLTVTQPSYAIFEVHGSFDNYMELYRTGAPQAVAQDDDSGSGTNARIESQLSPGQYTLIVRAYRNGASGSYTLQATGIR